MKLWMVLLIILVILVAALVVLYFLGKRAEKKQAEQKEQLDAVAQTLNMLIIDKKKLRIKNAGFPAVVLENTPKYLRWSKVPVVKAKVGPRVMTLMCDAQIYDLIPIKKEVKAVVSGIYITNVKGVRGPLEAPKKKKLMERIKERIKGGETDTKTTKGGKSGSTDGKETKAARANGHDNAAKVETKAVSNHAANTRTKAGKDNMASGESGTGKGGTDGSSRADKSGTDGSSRADKGNANGKKSSSGKGATSGKSKGSKGQQKKAKKKKK